MWRARPISFHRSSLPELCASSMLLLNLVLLATLAPKLTLSSPSLVQEVSENGTRPVADGPRQPAACSELVEKVALLFLVTEDVALEVVWGPWFGLAKDLVPLNTWQRVSSDQSARERLMQACTPRADAGILDVQNLFSIYVHRPANEPALQRGSIFKEKDIASRVNTEYGEHSIVEALRQLLRAGLEDHANSKFVMVSGSCVPLYPPTTIYMQLLSEPLSRINACPTGNRQQYRWHGMDYGSHPVSMEDWRWSGGRSALRRDHAELVAADVHFNRMFRMHCVFKESGCLSDEHYIPTLLSKLHRKNETDCTGLLTRDYFGVGFHPRAFEAPEVTPDLFREMRSCSAPTAQGALAHFVNLSHTEAATGDIAEWSKNTLGSECPLLGRKFPKRAAERIRQTLYDCHNDLQFVPTCSRH